MLIVTVGYRCAIYFESLFCVSPRVFSVVKLTLLLLFSFNFIYSSALICSRGGDNGAAGTALKSIIFEKI